MRKIDRATANAYFRIRTTLIVIYLSIGFLVSFGVVFFARDLSSFSVMGVPFHYYMGSQGAIVTFIILLFVNAKVSDVVDKKFGITPEQIEQKDKVVNQ
ncbi:DUF4212 domain-containing protein [Halobacillus mangrovi]|uniref:Sodium symporter small subunit domain-containing protein n=1 Tax=Halobacillus mangrovi TaxID=402384 RepID=A0A1W5ZSA9_9BACI|nr:sodium/substrate symporter small subunit [Halobacillus mangrovi]ARI76155.1 hypothetical protein HM131_04590 [Halobacillus mangrovi]